MLEADIYRVIVQFMVSSRPLDVPWECRRYFPVHERNIRPAARTCVKSSLAAIPNA